MFAGDFKKSFSLCALLGMCALRPLSSALQLLCAELPELLAARGAAAVQ